MSRWVSTLRTPDGLGLTLATTGASAALLTSAVVREAPRLAITEPPRAAAVEASGFPLFLAPLAFGTVAIHWVRTTTRS